MDKTWIKAPITSETYKIGAQFFINFAKAKAVRGEIICPCLKCCNQKWLKIDLVHLHIISKGFLPGYTTWTFHGEQRFNPNSQANQSHSRTSGPCETFVNEENLRDLIKDALGFDSRNYNIDQVMDKEDTNGNFGQQTHEDIGYVSSQSNFSDSNVRYKKLLEECDKDLYPGCKYSNLSFNLHLYHLKCMGGISNKIFTMLLEFLNDVFPHLTSIPSTSYEAKKLTNDLGLGYEKIHACPNDCMLFWGERENQDSCHICNTSRWKNDDNGDRDNDVDESSIFHKKKPMKVLRYFPLVPRLKRIYMSSKTAKDMRWHEESRTKDGKLRHPADGQAWKSFDAQYSEFASDPRSVRLGLASDGFNPYRTMSTTYSTWPVLLIPYNLPPWLCMKQYSLILSMIIPGEKGPVNDIDVYLQLLIHELKQLWEGVDAYDAYAKENFKLRAALTWTVNDFPAYANLSGWSTKGRVACPPCGSSTYSVWLKHGRKFSYMGHRKWLEPQHQYRFQYDQFDGTIERGSPPVLQSGSDILQQLEGVKFTYGKKNKSSKKRTREEGNNFVCDDMLNEETILESPYDDFLEEDIDGEDLLWKKRSIFFDLPYWEYNLLRHNLDVMHIEKNVCDNLIGTLLNLNGKTKDNEKARKDLMEMGIKHDLHLVEHPDKKPSLPPACYTLSSVEKSLFLQVLKDLKVPDGYASNVSRGVNVKEHKIFNLKSHDCHILMQDILPIALRASLHSQSQTWVVKVVSDLCYFFKGICSKVIDLDELDKLEILAMKTLCELEKIFPPSFFTIMVHLTIHLAAEVRLGGPVPYRWMYPIERSLSDLKSYVRNRARPEGSIAEGYVAEECLTFCSRYFEGLETPLNRLQRNDHNVLNSERYLLNSGGRVLGKVELIELDQNSLAQAHRYVLLNYDKIQPYRDVFLAQEKALRNGQMNVRTEEKLLVEKFPGWMKSQVASLEKNKCDKKVIAIARGPMTYAKRCNGFIINGFRFHTKSRERYRRTQNSGVCVNGEDKTYYGVIREIIELDYFGDCKVVLFRCDWVDVRPCKGLKLNKYGYPMVNFSRLMHTGELLKDDPFIISSQATQAFYVADQKDLGWSHVVCTKPRCVYDMGLSREEDDDESYTECMPQTTPSAQEYNEMPSRRRFDIEEDI